MKNLIIMFLVSIIMFVGGIVFTVETMKVDIVSETEEGAIVRVIVLDQWFNYFVEKN